MGMGFAPTWLRQVSPASHDHFNHCLYSYRNAFSHKLGISTGQSACSKQWLWLHSIVETEQCEIWNTEADSFIWQWRYMSSIVSSIMSCRHDNTSTLRHRHGVNPTAHQSDVVLTAWCRRHRAHVEARLAVHWHLHNRQITSTPWPFTAVQSHCIRHSCSSSTSIHVLQ